LKNGTELSQRLETVYIEIKDIAREITEKSGNIEIDPQEIKKVQERLDLIYSLQQKHRCDTIAGLIKVQNELEQKLSNLSSFDEMLNILGKKVSEKEKTVMDLAKQLSDKRGLVLVNIQSNIENQLRELGIPNAHFSIMHKQTDNLRDTGIDEIQFLFSANKNSEPSEINKVASGGELSRVMLCIKSLLSSAKGLPTLIFDEIDTGVSGEIADKMGCIMQKMGENIQVISITHLPQIAGKGKRHYKVYKTDTDHQTITEIKLLEQEERVIEIAGMLSGAELSDAALQNARYLLKGSE
jgi:DNA repair protein RecN (Recombination protein N)